MFALSHVEEVPLLFINIFFSFHKCFHLILSHPGKKVLLKDPSWKPNFLHILWHSGKKVRSRMCRGGSDCSGQVSLSKELLLCTDYSIRILFADYLWRSFYQNAFCRLFGEDCHQKIFCRQNIFTLLFTLISLSGSSDKDLQLWQLPGYFPLYSTQYFPLTQRWKMMF